MKTAFFLLMTVLFSGCTSIEIPNYIPDEHPYERMLYTNFDNAINVTSQSLEELGWDITTSSDPSVFERVKQKRDPDSQQIVLFTQVRKTPLFFGSRYARVNAFLRTAGENMVECEIRYVTVTSMPYKSFYNYRKDKVAQKILETIEDKLN